jgi:hypothetical protein
MHSVKKAKYIRDYKIEVTFADKKTKVVDLREHLRGEIFAPLQDVAYFKTFRVNEELDTIVWDNGADLCPDFLYEIGK